MNELNERQLRVLRAVARFQVARTETYDYVIKGENVVVTETIYELEGEPFNMIVLVQNGAVALSQTGRAYLTPPTSD